ncbi:helix-turn-helix transcriptional regulator [Mycobacterium heckeshornense]|uniref:helix-turn-helix transcriptional regulator n=1 Tax=Mycobacterium heckeshornense TaxID=110505 RepID=UPI00069D242A|nr:helix-turn-helix transcriptional regulator [Mycobacterium heckeshornense]
MTSAPSAPPGGDAAIARVGRAVADRRIELGIASQRELAETAGVALNTAAQLERGHTFPRRSSAHKLEKALRWPPGTLAAIRRGEPVPTEHPAATAQPVPPSPSPATSGVHAVGIAMAVVNIAAKSMDILLRHGADDPETGAVLLDLDAQLLALETLIAASLPHAADSFDETVSALAEVHRHREALKSAVAG